MTERKKDAPEELKQLGSNRTEYLYEDPTHAILETFPNKFPERDYVIHFNFPEFTSLCPKTGQPDFASIHVEYIPNEKCVESKSFKLYMFAYRNCGSFMETIVNNILSDLVTVCSPRWMKVVGDFNPRGGLKITPIAVFTEPGFVLPQK